MKLIIKNNSSDTFAYLSGTIVIPPVSTTEIPASQWFPISHDVDFLKDCKSNNLVLNNGISDCSCEQVETFFKDLLSVKSTAFDPVSKAKASVESDNLDNLSSSEGSLRVLQRNKLAKHAFDKIDFTYDPVTQELMTVVYKQGNTVMTTLALAYDQYLNISNITET